MSSGMSASNRVYHTTKSGQHKGQGLSDEDVAAMAEGYPNRRQRRAMARLMRKRKAVR